MGLYYIITIIGTLGPIVIGGYYGIINVKRALHWILQITVLAANGWTTIISHTTGIDGSNGC